MGTKIAVFLISIFCSSIACAAAPWDDNLTKPPLMPTAEVTRAVAELHPSVVEKTKVAYARDQGGTYTESEEDASAYVELEVAYRKSRHTRSASSLTEVELYGEYPLSTDFSVWGNASHSPDFKAVYAGIMKKTRNWSLALGGGSARYDNKSRAVLNPWIFYNSEKYEALLVAERYSGDDDPWFFKGYVQMRFTNVLAGVYGEKDFGIGPMVTYHIGKNAKIWGAVPLAHKPSEEDRMKFLVGMTFWF